MVNRREKFGLNDRQVADRKFHVDAARVRVQKRNPELARLVDQIALSTQLMKSGEEASADAGEILDKDLCAALVTLIFEAVGNDCWVTTSDKNGTTKISVKRIGNSKS
jgi:hypothetical protein